MSSGTRFEDLPDEMLLTIFRYLRPLDILDCFLNLNYRLNSTITNYRERVVISHLSHADFHHLLFDLLPRLAPTLRSLIFNNASMLDASKIFEKKFNKIDQDFPRLVELIFRQIDIETLEDLSWRFNTMHSLRRLDIDIAERRISSMPISFHEFLCGKIFSSANSIESLKLHSNNHPFTLYSIDQKCQNFRDITISVQNFNDLFILFDYLPNIEQLKITINSLPINNNVNCQEYKYEHLWWKVPYLKLFQLNINTKEQLSKDYTSSNYTVPKIVQNLYSISQFKFTLQINFSLWRLAAIPKGIYVDNYLHYINGQMWQESLQRNDNRSIRFDLHIELDDIPNEVTGKFSAMVDTSFSSWYWLKKNIAIHCCCPTGASHVSIYTLPITASQLSTSSDTVAQEITLPSSISHPMVRDLVLISNRSIVHRRLPLIELLAKFPNLTRLEIDTPLDLPEIETVCSSRLNTLSLNHVSLRFIRSLLNYLPRIASLTIVLNNDLQDQTNFLHTTNPILSVMHLTMILKLVSQKELSMITHCFPNVNAFNLTINEESSAGNIDRNSKFDIERILSKFVHLRYTEFNVPLKNDCNLPNTWMYHFNTAGIQHIVNVEGARILLKAWL